MAPFFAVIQEGHAVYGVGRSPEDAIISASRLGSPQQIEAALVDLEAAQHGDIVLAECTEKLFDQVMKFGVEWEFEYTEDGLADLEHHTPAAPVEIEQYAC